MKIERFEDIKAWQEARSLVKILYLEAKANNAFWRDYKFREHIIEAAVSIMSNIAEGFSRRTKKEFVQFLFIAKGSAAEVQSKLYVALDLGYVSEETFKKFYSKVDEIAKMLSGFITYLLKELK